jgi:uncharacterized protein (TIGR00251 family)
MNFSRLMKVKIIKLYVKPNSVNTCVDGLYGNRVRVRISSPPERGKANKELIKFISTKLNISKKSIKIVSGKKSKFKDIAIEDTSPQDLSLKLLS